jgi:hypothetical protein
MNRQGQELLEHMNFIWTSDRIMRREEYRGWSLQNDYVAAKTSRHGQRLNKKARA